ncbi:hypothetical protein GCM10010954_14020 [Halobacillus andaensis]|uniref:DUF3231 family protein n=1 Tax=Halobacillus andaensis TaxID=1176239 RepID=A0A917B1H4_HALAA|nr:DUF3231 family protein [Halobacillus andaensis]MBP2004204.1 hypothetical protein [Halobacillus andaensis]GGF16613.1 hypothetical protein GCM10010954_14020 [Halobacillus andaensis]
MTKKLTTNEIGTLWTQNLQAGMSIQVLKYFLETVEDENIKEIIDQAFQVSNDVYEQTQHYLEAGDLPIPVGFTEDDVNLEAPKLFSDALLLQFVENMGKAGLLAYSVSLSSSVTQEVRSFYSNILIDTTKFFNSAVTTSISKGIFTSSPQIEIEKEVEFVKGKKYLSPFHKRSLNAVEMTHLFENIKSNAVGELLCTGFAQTTNSKKVQTFMIKGRDTSQKHIKLFTQQFNESNIHPPMGSSAYVTQSTIAPFTNKLIVFLISVLTSTGQGNYSTASSASLRYDLVLLYQKLAIETGLYAKDGLDLMIKNQWLEEPPQAVNRTKLFDLIKE